MTSTLPPPPFSPSPPRARRDLWRIQPTLGTLAAIVAGGFAFDIGVRHPIGALSFLSVSLTAGAALRGGWIRGAVAQRLLLLALVPGSLLMLRASMWLVPLNIAATVVLLLLAAMVRDEPQAVGRALGRIVRPLPLAEPAAMSVDLVGRAAASAARGRPGLIRQIIRIGIGTAIALPIFLSLTALLAASDALFSSWLGVSMNIPSLLGHLCVAAIGATFVAGWAGHGGWATVNGPVRDRKFIGTTEAAVVLASVVVVFGLFVAAQVVAIASGPGYVERTTGLTYAEYARAGFFQLVAAAVLTLLTLTTIRRFRHPSISRTGRWVARLELAIVGLTLLVVAVAIRRLFLYEAEFGLTMLRLSTIIFAAFIGFIFVVTGLSLTGRLRRSPVAVVFTGALVVLFAVNIANPEAIVAERNVSRFGGTSELDIEYLVENLGTDAYPAIAADPAARAELCRRAGEIDDRMIIYNLSRQRAADVCSG